jgi:probable blue pigment (indigoidine) exporter
MAMIGPALLGASSLACADILSKVTFRSGADPLTVATLRGVIGLAVLLLWLRIVRPSIGIPPRERWISLGLGVLFAGNVLLLFKAIVAIDVTIAILTYFVYPLLTGIAAAAIGLDKLSWRGLLAAVCAFLGLAMMLGAAPAGLAQVGVLAALAAAGCRVAMLLITRATMQGINPLAITLYSMVSSTAVLAAASLFTGEWQPPLTPVGWVAAVGLSVCCKAEPIKVSHELCYLQRAFRIKADCLTVSRRRQALTRRFAQLKLAPWAMSLSEWRRKPRMNGGR